MGTLTVSLQFIKRLNLYESEKPFQIFGPVPDSVEDKRTDNLEFEDKEQTIYDMREATENFTLDDHGFTFLVHQPSWMPNSTSSRADVEENYLPDVDKLIREQIDDVDEIFFFDWKNPNHTRIKKMRDTDRSKTDVDLIDLNDPLAVLRPATHVHIDQSPSSVVHRTELQLADHADFLLRGRVRIINVWRPLDHPVSDYLLGICDGKTVSEADLYECDVVRVHFLGGTIYVAHNEAQKWYYLSNQQTSEILLLKMFDSHSNVVKACPHGAFLQPDTRPDTPKRKSVEVRALVFTYPHRFVPEA